jgi:hypothetical protein
VDYESGNTGKLTSIARSRLFENLFAPPQPRLFDLGSVGWLRALKLNGYALGKAFTFANQSVIYDLTAPSFLDSKGG